MDPAVSELKVVFVDLDNTIYDWLGFFGPAMRGLCSRLSELAGVSESELYREFKDVFRRAGSVEYTTALQELPTLARLNPDKDRADLANYYFDAIKAFQYRRRMYLRLYPTVIESLEQLRDWGITVIAVTDGHRFQVLNRLWQLKVSDLFYGVCCLPDPPVDEGEIARIRRYPDGHYSHPAGKDLIAPEGVRKPDPRLLTALLGEVGAKPEEALYIGDSLTKDVLMAQAAGVFDCWSAYGAGYSAVDLKTLLRVTNWSADAIEAMDAGPDQVGVHPSFVATSFADVVTLAGLPRRKWPNRSGWSAVKIKLPGFELGPESALETQPVPTPSLASHATRMRGRHAWTQSPM